MQEPLIAVLCTTLKQNQSLHVRALRGRAAAYQPDLEVRYAQYPVPAPTGLLKSMAITMYFAEDVVAGTAIVTVTDLGEGVASGGTTANAVSGQAGHRLTTPRQAHNDASRTCRCVSVIRRDGSCSRGLFAGSPRAGVRSALRAL